MAGSKSRGVRTKGKEPVPAVLVDRHSGLAYLGPLDRIRHGLKKTDIRRMITCDADGLWGPDASWTQEEVKASLVRLVAEGTSARAALKTLSDEAGGGMPSFWKITRWVEEDPEFKKDLQTAERAYGEILADAALEAAMGTEEAATPVEVAGAKVRVQALQWRASKASRDKYGEHQKVEVEDNRPHGTKSLDHLKAELVSLLSDPLVARGVNALGIAATPIEDAEIVEPGESPA